MHPGILSVGIENGGHWPWPSGSFWTFWLRILRNFTCLHDICNGFELESPNLHQICLLGFAQLVLKMEVIDLDLQGLAIISTQEIALNFALVYWSRPAKGCYTSQTCACYVILIHPIHSVHCQKYVKNVLNLLNLLFNVGCHCVEFGFVPVTCTGILTCTRGLTIDHKWWTHYRSQYNIIYMNTLYFRKRENGYEQCGKTAEIQPKQDQRPFWSGELSDKGTGVREEKSKKS